MPFVGIIATHQNYVSPAEFAIHVTKKASETRQECVAEVWKMMLADIVFDIETFQRHTLDNLHWELRQKFVEKRDSEDFEEDKFISDKELLQQISLTEEELQQLLYVFYGDDYNFVLQINTI